MGKFRKQLTNSTRDINDDFFWKTTEILASTALTGKDPLTRRHAVYLLGMTRNLYFVEIFIGALRDPEKEVRNQATRALVEIGEPVSERLFSLLDDPDWKVRYRAAEALGIMNEKRAVIPLTRLLSDEKDHVRYMAVKSLGQIGDKEATIHLGRLLKDTNPWVRAIAQSVIGTHLSEPGK